MILAPRNNFAEETIYQVYVLQLYVAASMAFLYYEYFATVLSEIRLVWSRRLNFTSFLFLVNRYAVLLGYFVTIYFTYNAPFNLSTCSKVVRIPGYLNILTQIVITVMLSFRTYALYFRNMWVLVTTLSTGFIVIAIFCVVLDFLSGSIMGFDAFGISDLKACYPGMLTASWSIQLVFILTTLYDGMIFLLTIIKTVLITRATRSRLSRHLMRDGSIYFGLVFIANIVNLIFFLESPNAVYPESAGNGSILSHVLSATMISRLYLNLQDQLGDRVIVYGTGAISMRDRDRDQDSHPLTTWIVRVTNELDSEGEIFDADVNDAV